MIKKLLLFTLAIACFIEITLTVLCFFAPIKAMVLFDLEYSEQTAFLAYIIAWFCLLVSLLIIYAMVLVKKNNACYVALVYLLGIWWVGLGVGVYIVFGKVDNLFLDSLKGLLLIGLNFWNNKLN